MKTCQIKNFVKKITLLLVAFLTFASLSEKSLAQTTHPDSSIGRIPNNPAHPATIHNPYQKPDTSSIGKAAQAKPKLTAAQIKKIAGNDKAVGKDSEGRQLYQDADGKRYYINDSGTKVYIK